MFEGIKIMADNISRDMQRFADDAINDSLIDMSDMNREQLTFGLNTEGGKVGDYRSEPYARLKKAIGGRAPFGEVDLKLTGDFHSSIFAARRDNEIVFGATDPKTPDLTEKYDNVLGLTPENTRTTLDGYIYPTILTRLSAQFRIL